MKGAVLAGREDELAALLARLAHLEATNKVYRECLADAAARIEPIPCTQHGTGQR